MTPFSMLSTPMMRIVQISFYLWVILGMATLVIHIWHRVSRFSIAMDAILLVTTILICAVLRLDENYVTGELYRVAALRLRIPAVIPVLYLVITLIWYLYSLWTGYQKHRSIITPSSIRYTINNLPDGLLLATADGLPVLTNRRMYTLAEQIQGTPLVNANQFYERLIGDLRGVSGDAVDYAGSVSRRIEDGTVWRFIDEDITIGEERFVEIRAVDTTASWQLSQELFQKNERLMEQKQRLQLLLQNLSAIQQNEELLASKIRVHDQLGSAILTTKHYLIRNTCQEESETKRMLRYWKHLVSQLKQSDFNSVEHNSALQELIDIGENLGCEIQFIGAFQEGDKVLLQAVRECLTNAVRHAKATKLFVETKIKPHALVLVISDNGVACAQDRITEGVGLTTLRHQVERSGGTMRVECKEGVTLTIEQYRKEEMT